MKNLITLISIVLALLHGHAALAANGFREQPLHLDEHGTGQVKDRIKGEQTVDYRFHGSAGQAMTVRFNPSNLSAYFNLLPPGSEEALFIGATNGNRFTGRLPAEGEYTIRVYLMRNAARRNETARYTLSVTLAADDNPALSAVPTLSSPAFDRTMELQGIRFRVTCANAGSINTLRIAPSGLEIDNSPIERTIDGIVSGAEVADLNGDGSPEIYVYIRSAGSGSYGSMVAYSANRRKSLSEIYIPPLTEREGATTGYMGHDEFSVLEGTIGRRFPVYRNNDSNANPTGGTRQFQYKLKQGEANWMLQLDKSFEF